MKIALLDSISSHNAQRGVSRCFDEIARELINDPAHQCTWISSRPAPCGVNGGGDYSKLLNLLKRLRMPVGRIGAKIAGAGNYDVVLDAYYSAFLKSKNRATIVYDMIHELRHLKYCRDRSDIERFVVNKRNCVDQSRWLICISESTKRDLISLVPDAAARCRVMHLGIRDVEPVAPAELPNRPYFLFVGNRTGYKNFLRCIIGFSKSNLAASHDLLVVSPSAGPTEEEAAIASEFGVSKAVHYRSSPSDAQVAWYYSQSVALLYLSLYEGFGFPVVEGMRYRTPVICSSGSSMGEIAAGHARACDSESSDDLAAALVWASQLQGEERRAWIEQAHAYSLKFNWGASLAQLNKALEQVHPH
jgi:glycosyltransferase involved in cell wall biosynthesis